MGNEELKAALGRTELHGVKGGVPGLPELCVILLEEKEKGRIVFWCLNRLFISPSKA